MAKSEAIINMSDEVRAIKLEPGCSNGPLVILEKEGKFYWAVEDYHGYNWYEISEKLYSAIVEFEEERKMDNPIYKKFGGPIIKGTTVTVMEILYLIIQGLSNKEIIERLPVLSEAHILAAKEYSAYLFKKHYPKHKEEKFNLLFQRDEEIMKVDITTEGVWNDEEIIKGMSGQIDNPRNLSPYENMPLGRPWNMNNESDKK